MKATSLRASVAGPRSVDSRPRGQAARCGPKADVSRDLEDLRCVGLHLEEAPHMQTYTLSIGQDEIGSEHVNWVGNFTKPLQAMSKV